LNIIVLDITGLFGFILSMHVEIVPNRMALPAFLLRNKFRDDNKAKLVRPRVSQVTQVMLSNSLRQGYLIWRHGS
jgi:hypothetical protein